MFEADNGTGDELWSSDGTPAGTVLVKVINTTPSTTSGSNVQNLVAIGVTKVLFQADDGSTGVELWETDGSAFGTIFNQNFRPETPGLTKSSLPSNTTEFKGKHYFQADDGITGKELWVTDNTAGGTFLLKDINQTPNIVQSSSPSNFFVVDDMLFFTANDGVNGTELWVTDGSAGGTVLVKDQAIGATFNVNSREKIAFDGKMIFQARDGFTGNELWVSDGTAAGSFQLRDFRTGASFDNGTPAHLTHFKGKIWMTARDNDGTSNYEFWTTDGTVAGTVQAFDFNSSVFGAQGVEERSEATVVVLGDHLYFVGDSGDGVIGWALYRTDGTLAGTTLVKDLRPTSTSQAIIHELQVVDNKFYFQARYDNDVNIGFEPFVSDGTPAGTGLLADLRAGTSSSSPLEHSWREVSGVTMFIANSGNGNEWHTTDGIPGGTTAELLDIRVGSSAGVSLSSTANVLNTGTRFAYFNGNDGTNGTELWKTDGTVVGTVMTADLNPTGNGNPLYQNMARGDVSVRMDAGLLGQEPYTYFPGASGQNLGNGCNKSNSQASIPQISANDPVLDGFTSVSVVLDTDAPLTPCVIVIGAPGLTAAGGGCNLYTSFNVFTELSTTDANGDRLMFGVPVPVPLDPSLVGTTVVCQGVVDSAPTNPFGIAFSNAREVTGGL